MPLQKTGGKLIKLTRKFATQMVLLLSYFKNLATSLITTNTQDKAIEIKKGDLND
ncbi:hypothetical protein [Lactobacillus helveticus]|uniref:hypothetical protein n=1 Tax=Lactobacillus helveticus TaxID=1587 RepID=UPI00386A8A75